jgi:hypothetical protein
VRDHGPVRWRLVLGFIVGTIWLLLALLPTARAAAWTALLMPEVLNLGGPRPIALVSGAPTREPVRLTRADADLYRPSGGGRHGGLVMTLGVHPVDKRDPLVVRLAEGLARSGLAVMLVQSDDLISDRIVSDEPANLVEAFQRLAADPSVEPGHVGLFGFSAGASLAFLSATDERIADQVRLVGWLGGYADAVELTEQIVEGAYEDDGHVVAWQPHELSRYVFEKQLADAGLDVPAVQTSGVTGELRQRLEAVSPLRAIGRFHSRAYLLVDRADLLIPYVHTRALARALPPRQVARYDEFDLFEHVQPTKPLPPLEFAREALKLASAVAAILADLDPASS